MSFLFSTSSLVGISTKRMARLVFRFRSKRSKTVHVTCDVTNKTQCSTQHSTMHAYDTMSRYHIIIISPPTKMQAYTALLQRHGSRSSASSSSSSKTITTVVARRRALAGGSILSLSEDNDQRRIRSYSSSSPLSLSLSLPLPLPLPLPRTSLQLSSPSRSLKRNYYTLPPSAAAGCAAINNCYHPSSSSLAYCNDSNNNHSLATTATTATTTLIQKRHKVFVSKHNSTLNLTPQQITSYLCQQLPHLSSTNHDDDHFRITNSHVIMKECPFCSKPTHGKSDNYYKCYIALGMGAYFCHRCGCKGSWYDLKSELGGFSVVDNTGGGQSSSSGSGSTSGRQQNNYNANNYHNANHNQQPQQQQPQPQRAAPQPLPMPHTKLNSLHSSRLFDPSNSISHNTQEYNAMTYLQQVRGLDRSVLRKYGVGCASYKFPSKKKKTKMNNNNNNNSDVKANKIGSGSTMEYVSSMCVTFPWLMRQSEVQEQEELRGAEYLWRKDEEEEEDDNEEDSIAGDENDKEKEQRQRELLERESSKRRIEAAVAAAVSTKKNSKARSEMTALERYYAKRDRKSSRNTKDKKEDMSSATSSSDKDEFEQFQFTPQVQQQQQIPEPLTSEEVESLHGPYITRRIKVRSIEQKSWQRLDPPGGGFGLFGWHTIPHDATEIIITEGEFDAMAVYQATGRHVVSLPNGCRSLPMEVLVLLERFDTVYLWMDNDGPGREGAEMFARKLGVERCLLVQPSGKRGWNGGVNKGGSDDNYDENGDESISTFGSDESRPPPPKDANEALLQGWDINELLNEASELPHERILKFSDLRDQVREMYLS